MTTVSRPLCDRTRALLSRSLDDGLSELERRAVDAHTTRCAACHEFERETRWFTNELRRAPLVALAEPVALSRARRRLPVRAIANVSSAAALLLATVGGLSLATSADPPATPQALAPAIDPLGGDMGIRELRRAALQAGELAVLPATEPPRHGKPVLLATDE